MALPADWRTETLITIAEAAVVLDCTPQAVYRMISPGAKLPGGGRVQLEWVRRGFLRTSQEAIDRFIERCSPQPEGESGRTPSEARRAGRAAGARLRAKLAGGAG